MDQTNKSQDNHNSLPDFNLGSNITPEKDGKVLYDVPVLNCTLADKPILALSQGIDYKKLFDLDQESEDNHEKEINLLDFFRK